MPYPTPVIVSEEERIILEKTVKSPISKQREAFRAKIILLLAEGYSAEAVAKECKTSMATVSKWRTRWSRHKLEGLKDIPGRGRKSSMPASAIAAALSLAKMQRPGGGVWSNRTAAEKTGLSKTSVQRLWSTHGLRPHKEKTFKLSKDLQFEEKLYDVVGLYMNPPEQAIVLSCDEKSQCQALERTQPGLPLGMGHIRTRTHDYFRHGTVTLFAALDCLSGKVISHTAPRHRHQEWLAFLRKIDKDVDKALEIHVICDNYATHKHQKVAQWLKRHPRFHLHFTPTSASWLNLVERFFGEITRRVIRPGSFCNVGALVDDINRFLAVHNENPKPYRWTADPACIIEKVYRAWEVLSDEIYKPLSGPLH